MDLAKFDVYDLYFTTSQSRPSTASSFSEASSSSSLKNFKMSTFEIIIHLLMRFSQRFTVQERIYLERETGKPVTLLNKDGQNGKYYPLSKVAQLIKTWKKSRSHANIPVTDRIKEVLTS